VRLLILLTSAMFSSFGWSCTSGTVAPGNVALRMEMRVSSATGDPTHPVTVHTRVTNAGRKPVTYMMECVNPTLTRLTDPEARHVNTLCGTCPNALCPACAPMPRTIPPGESIDEDFQFTGGLRDCAGNFQGASGEYHADAKLTATGPNGSTATVEKSVKFTWTAEN